MLKRASAKLLNHLPAPVAEAHCDGPCGVYDPASARIAAEAVLAMTKKILALEHPDHAKGEAVHLAYSNTLSRYIAIKDEQAHIAKTELLVLWTDYFKPEHLKDFPDLHDTFWKAAKLCSAVKVNVSEEKATELLKAIEEIHKIFWKTKQRNVAWYTAN
jgi:nickel superoxide dismutase